VSNALENRPGVHLQCVPRLRRNMQPQFGAEAGSAACAFMQ
jgi:hypothetical protein